MNIHFIVAPSTHLRPLMKELSSKHHITTLPEEMTSNTDCVVVDPHLSEHHPDLLQAQQLGLKLLSPAEFLYEYFKDKTRVVIAGEKGRQEVLARVLHTMAFYNKPLSYCLQQPIIGQQVHLEDTEFVLIEADAQSAALRPIVALITDIAATDSRDTYNAFISAITKGGILIYNEEDTTLSSIVEANENPIRKMEYHTPDFETHNDEIYLITPEGDLPLGKLSAASLGYIEAAKWVCQNMAIDEADFYEAMADYHL